MNDDLSWHWRVGTQRRIAERIGANVSCLCMYGNLMKYRQAFEIAEEAIRCRESRGHIYLAGAARAAALAAVPQGSAEAVCDVIIETLYDYEFPENVDLRCCG